MGESPENAYLARNAVVMDELSRTPLRLGREVGRSGRYGFHTAGDFASRELVDRMFVGLKVERSKHRYLLEQHFLEELATIAEIADKLPHLVAKLPAFYGLVRSQQGEPLAIVTEDFSRGGKVVVTEARDRDIEHQIKRVFPETNGELLSRIGFRAGQQFRLGELASLVTMTIESRASDSHPDLPLQYVAANANRYTYTTGLEGMPGLPTTVLGGSEFATPSQ